MKKNAFNEFIPHSTTIIFILVMLLIQSVFVGFLNVFVNIPILGFFILLIESALFWGTIIFVSLIGILIELLGFGKDKNKGNKVIGVIITTVLLSYLFSIIWSVL